MTHGWKHPVLMTSSMENRIVTCPRSRRTSFSSRQFVSRYYLVTSLCATFKHINCRIWGKSSHDDTPYSMGFSVEVSIAVHRIQILLIPAIMRQRAEHSHICSLNQRDAKRGSYFHLLTPGEHIFRREFRPKYAWPIGQAYFWHARKRTKDVRGRGNPASCWNKFIK